MNKADLIEVVQQQLGENCSRAHAERCVNCVLEAISQGLSTDQSVQLVGFGTFQVRERKARVGLNPQTREPMQIAASKTVGFRPGNKLKEAI
ncbi:MAG: HU family DNA-binding protein [Planctomycetota bacterium]|jgi:nucleoid DNA-binding protein